jgi:hypothetical protein
MNHRKGGDIMFDANLELGVLTGAAIRFSARAQVQHQAEIPCRKKGDASCTYHVTW